jgi:large subunit ribosomal protein L25
MNQETNPAVKLSSAVISHVLNELEIECLPSALPEFIEVDLATMQAGQSVHAKDIPLPAGVSLVAHVEAENPVIAAATIPAGAIAEGDAAAAEGETPAA